MVWEKHPAFIEPPYPNAQIWRYMDIAKLVSMLENKALYFPRASQLTENDPYEGLFPQGQIDTIYSAWAEEIAKDAAENRSVEEISTDLKAKNYEQFTPKWLQHAFLVNGWYLGEQESMAMWRQYAANLQGVVIVSTYTRLRQAFIEEHPAVHIGLVRYDDGARPYSNCFYPITFKRRAFEHERELRAVVWTIAKYRPDDKAGESLPEIDIGDEELGANIKVDLGELIQEIRTPPGCPEWFHSAVSAVVRRYSADYGISPLVRRSELDTF